MSHCEMHVVSLLLSLSCHRDSSSPFFTSQDKTSSFAPTKALPEPALRLDPSEDQTEFDDAVQTVPKTWAGSYFLYQLATAMRLGYRTVHTCSCAPSRPLQRLHSKKFEHEIGFPTASEMNSDPARA